jgi:hypothetical protein
MDDYARWIGVIVYDYCAQWWRELHLSIPACIQALPFTHRALSWFWACMCLGWMLLYLRFGLSQLGQFCPKPKNIFPPKSQHPKCPQNHETFYRNSLTFYRNSLTFYRNLLRFMHNTLRFYRNSLTFYRNLLRFMHNTLRFYRNSLTFYRNSLTFYRNLLRFMHNTLRFY